MSTSGDYARKLDREREMLANHELRLIQQRIAAGTATPEDRIRAANAGWKPNHPFTTTQTQEEADQLALMRVGIFD
jgi:hypothetical protein